MLNVQLGGGNMARKIQTSIVFVWDLDKLEIADNVKFVEGTDQLGNYLLDSTVALIKEAMKDDRIFSLINVIDLQTKGL
jgi:hypothetical protein